LPETLSRVSLTSRRGESGDDLQFLGEGGDGEEKGFMYRPRRRGWRRRWDYGAIGTVTNLAARLCGEAQPGQILISPRLEELGRGR
jgi:hypothetical protein